jgi:hypothetical protein
MRAQCEHPCTWGTSQQCEQATQQRKEESNALWSMVTRLKYCNETYLSVLQAFGDVTLFDCGLESVTSFILRTERGSHLRSPSSERVEGGGGSSLSALLAISDAELLEGRFSSGGRKAPQPALSVGAPSVAAAGDGCAEAVSAAPRRSIISTLCTLCCCRRCNCAQTQSPLHSTVFTAKTPKAMSVGLSQHITKTRSQCTKADKAESPGDTRRLAPKQ